MGTATRHMRDRLRNGIVAGWGLQFLRMARVLRAGTGDEEESGNWRNGSDPSDRAVLEEYS